MSENVRFTDAGMRPESVNWKNSNDISIFCNGVIVKFF